MPIIHSTCIIECSVTDFNFTGLLDFMKRIPPDEQKHLLKNENLRIRLHTSLEPRGQLDTLRKWLQYRADKCRPQPKWRYAGARPSTKVQNDLRRREKRMTEPEKKEELRVMLKALRVRGFDDD